MTRLMPTYFLPFFFANMKYHLSVLRRFCSLYDAVEQTANSFSVSKSEILSRFLVSAEARYIRYLSLLEDWLEKEKEMLSPDTNIIDEIPLPPWYSLDII